MIVWLISLFELQIPIKLVLKIIVLEYQHQIISKGKYFVLLFK